MPLYHKDAFGLPAKIRIPRTIGFNLSVHAINQAQAKGIDLDKVKRLTHELSTIFPFDWDVFEVEIDNGIPVKIAARITYNESYDLCAVFLRGAKLIKTVWLNSKTDLHNTLDHRPYSKPQR